MKGGFGDNYYYQLASYIRRYKGARPLAAPSPSKTIRIDNAFDQWESVKPEYRDDLYDTAHRDHPGFAHAGPYQETSGRNDLDLMKVARDADTLYFYVRTREPIPAPAGDDWMTLLINSDRDHKTGWEGYDFLVNRKRTNASTCTLEKNTGGWKWQSVGDVSITWHGSELHLAIPRKLLGLSADQGKLSIEFKWADNIPGSGDILEFIQKGDTAPNGRFNYIFQE
jgi:hypothetical protein